MLSIGFRHTGHALQRSSSARATVCPHGTTAASTPDTCRWSTGARGEAGEALVGCGLSDSERMPPLRRGSGDGLILVIRTSSVSSEPAEAAGRTARGQASMDFPDAADEEEGSQEEISEVPTDDEEGAVAARASLVASAADRALAAKVFELLRQTVPASYCSSMQTE